MGDHLNRMKKIMDEHISLGSVFTEKDEQNILRKIHEHKKLPVSKKRPFIPALLTVALFAGLVLFTYSFFETSIESNQQAVHDKTDKTKKTENEVKVETKDESKATPIDPVIYFSDPKGEVVINKETNTLKISGSVTNPANELSPQYAVKVNILNPKLEGSLQELEIRFKDAQYANTGAGSTNKFWEEVPLLKEISKSDLENQVQISFTIDKKVVKTHIIENIKVIDEPPVEKQTMRIEEIKEKLARGMTQEEIQAQFGNKYTEVRGAMDNQNLWRFDIGADPSYNYQADDRITDSIDNKGLLNGTVDTILFVEWDENLKVNSFSFYNMLQYGYMYSYHVLEDGQVKEDHKNSGGIYD
ncbi:hypothetical protein M3196_08205 [Fictibacillus nanhaiensis]|uniref:hypothetical protein n=1 Tax=Fictibacillus nanhaiensis TaxID=742169 RepID=UPI00203D1EF5|nr:hypothetical protein [Fictibacillus nanhaiensis]MCM3731642.1 hypothetical protein [Fictibacillus nanhaiensis]